MQTVGGRMMTEVMGFLPSKWETCIAFLAVALGNEPGHGSVSLSAYLLKKYQFLKLSLPVDITVILIIE